MTLPISGDFKVHTIDRRGATVLVPFSSVIHRTYLEFHVPFPEVRDIGELCVGFQELCDRIIEGRLPRKRRGLRMSSHRRAKFGSLGSVRSGNVPGTA